MQPFSVIVPVHNEGPALVPFIQHLSTTLHAYAGTNWELILVDDGSTDDALAALGTNELCRQTIIRHPTRRGSGAARRTGILKCRSPILAWVDADGTYAPSDLVRALDALGSNDQVCGARTCDHGSLMGLRLLVKRVTCRCAEFWWQTPIPDINSGLRVFRTEALMCWVNELPDGFSCTSTATLAALNHRQKLLFLPIGYNSRSNLAHSKFHPIIDTLRLWRVVLRQAGQYRRNPRT